VVKANLDEVILIDASLRGAKLMRSTFPRADLVASLCEQDGLEGALVSKAALDAAIRALVGVAAAPA